MFEINSISFDLFNHTIMLVREPDGILARVRHGIHTWEHNFVIESASASVAYIVLNRINLSHTQELTEQMHDELIKILERMGM